MADSPLPSLSSYNTTFRFFLSKNNISNTPLHHHHLPPILVHFVALSIYAPPSPSAFLYRAPFFLYFFSNQTQKSSSVFLPSLSVRNVQFLLCGLLLTSCFVRSTLRRVVQGSRRREGGLDLAASLARAALPLSYELDCHCLVALLLTFHYSFRYPRGRTVTQQQHVPLRSTLLSPPFDSTGSDSRPPRLPFALLHYHQRLPRQQFHDSSSSKCRLDLGHQPLAV